ncbi:MAG: alpha/beta hydrolase [Hyphomicrobiales bacterium]|nr:MAG: alpha/beta hydrolase [Hyphomicrobiales bacterium]
MKRTGQLAEGRDALLRPREANVSTSKPDQPRTRWRLRRFRTAPLWPLAFALLLALPLYSEWLGFWAAHDHPPLGSLSAVGDITLHYRDIAPPVPKGTVVLIHGAWAAHADLLDALGPTLHDYRVIAIDRPGQGWSSRPESWDWASPQKQAAAVMALLDRIAPEPVVVVGYSLGGALSARIALERPERLRGVVLLGAVLYPWLGDLARYHIPITSPVIGPVFNRLVGIPLGSAMLPRGLSLAFLPQEAPAGYAEATELPLMFREAAFRNNLQDIVAADHFLRSQAPRYPAIRVPVIAITGDRDAIVSPAHSAAIARGVPTARLLVLPGVGHMLHRAQPQAIAQAITSLIPQP